MAWCTKMSMRTIASILYPRFSLEYSCSFVTYSHPICEARTARSISSTTIYTQLCTSSVPTKQEEIYGYVLPWPFHAQYRHLCHQHESPGQHKPPEKPQRSPTPAQTRRLKYMDTIVNHTYGKYHYYPSWFASAPICKSYPTVYTIKSVYNDHPINMKGGL